MQLKSYEYLQETVESIADDNWAMKLKKHGSQGWLLSAINHEETDRKRPSGGAAEKADDEGNPIQAIYIAVFMREL